MANSIIQSSQIDPKRKAITSLIFGFISATLSILTLAGGIYGVIGLPKLFGLIIMGPVMYCFALVPFTIIGVILGIMGMKSTKKRFAIAGTILSLFGLGTSIYIYIIALRIGTA
jgi:hypothetical protein